MKLIQTKFHQSLIIKNNQFRRSSMAQCQINEYYAKGINIRLDIVKIDTATYKCPSSQTQ